MDSLYQKDQLQMHNLNFIRAKVLIEIVCKVVVFCGFRLRKKTRKTNRRMRRRPQSKQKELKGR